MSHALRLHVSSYAPRSVLAAHVHNEAWLCLVLDGSYREHIRSRADDHGSGDLLFCPEHATHSQEIGAEGARKLIFSPPASALEYLLDHGSRLSEAPYLRRNPMLSQLGQRVLRELRIGDRFASLAIEGIAMELLAALARQEHELCSHVPDWLRRLREGIDDDPAQAWSLDRLAREAGRHPVHVARCFRQSYGCTIGEYIRRIRVDRAALLLRQSRMPLLEIALTCGFGDASTFSRSFKAALGVSPSNYREGVR
jgi:AraC family transcriptional regulator